MYMAGCRQTSRPSTRSGPSRGIKKSPTKGPSVVSRHQLRVPEPLRLFHLHTVSPDPRSRVLGNDSSFCVALLLWFLGLVGSIQKVVILLCNVLLFLLCVTVP